MPIPLTDKDRQHILKLHQEGLSRNAIAKKTGRGLATITRTVHAAGRTFDRRTPLEATANAAADRKTRRNQLMDDLLTDAAKLRTQLWQPTKLVNFGGKDNTLAETTLDEPLFVDKKNIMSAVGMAVDRLIKLEALDAENGKTEVESMLIKLIGSVGIPDE